MYLRPNTLVKNSRKTCSLNIPFHSEMSFSAIVIIINLLVLCTSILIYFVTPQAFCIVFVICGLVQKKFALILIKMKYILLVASSKEN